MMKHWLAAALLSASGIAVSAQSLADLNVEMHGYATQGFAYTTQNNWNTASTSSGSPAWMDTVLNVTAQPDPKLRIAAQGRYFLLGQYGNNITLDWATGDYKADSRFGVRFGKVKTPSGLFNEVQDIDPVLVWSLLPQSVYPLASRNSVLAHYGAVAYGDIDLSESLGSLDYRAFGGEREIAAGDGYFQPYLDHGINVPNGISGPLFGGAVRWHTPAHGLMVGASDYVQRFTASVTASLPLGPGGSLVTLSGPAHIVPFSTPDLFSKYEKKRVMLAGEYSRIPIFVALHLTGLPVPVDASSDFRGWYFMGTYQFSDRLTAGAYFSSGQNRQAPLGPARYQKDWAVSGRYYFNTFLYAKAEQHFVDGTQIGFSTSDNPDGLKPDTRMTILKIGATF